MGILSKLILGLAAGVGCSALIGYCFYFDQKRRSDPNYKRKVRERRQTERKQAAMEYRRILPDLSDPQMVKRFFLSEIENGEAHIQRGDYDRAAEHLYNALAVCTDPVRLITVFQNTLPTKICRILMIKMKAINDRTVANTDEPQNVHFRVPFISDPLAITMSLAEQPMEMEMEMEMQMQMEMEMEMSVQMPLPQQYAVNVDEVE